MDKNEELIAARKSCSLNQKKAAQLVKISYRQYQNIEAGKCKPNVETAISIADILGETVEKLFRRTDKTSRPRQDGQQENHNQ